MSPRALGILFVLLAVTFEALAQLAFKRAVDVDGGPAGVFGKAARVFRNPLFLGGLACYGLEAASSALALSRLDVSVVFPLGSLCFVAVAFFSRVLLHERVSGVRWAGVVVILLGVIITAWS